MDTLLDSTQAARLLGIKRSTLYVYVSRGYLKAKRQDDTHRSLFSLEEVQKLAERTDRGRKGERRLPPLATSITLATPSGLAYRGVQASALADTCTFEQLTDFLWQAEAGPWEPVAIERPRGATHAEVIRSVVARLTSNDHTGDDRSPRAVCEFARRLMKTIACALAPDSIAGTQQPGHASTIAQLLCQGIGVDPSNAGAVRAVDALLILLADHEFAPSTLAVRIAANVGSSLSNAILAGLGVLSGPLHDGSQRAFELLQQSVHEGAEVALRSWVDDGVGPPGFDRERQDPRARLIARYFDHLASPEQRSLYAGLLSTATEMELPLPGIDIAVAALTWALNAQSDAGSTMFAMARMAGWTAHYLEETLEPARRFHFQPVYVADLCRRRHPSTGVG